MTSNTLSCTFAEHKLGVLNILIHQLLSFVGCRDVIDDSFERLRHARNDLRKLQFQESKQDKDEASFKLVLSTMLTIIYKKYDMISIVLSLLFCRSRKKLEERAQEIERHKLEIQNLPISDELKPKVLVKMIIKLFYIAELVNIKIHVIDKCTFLLVYFQHGEHL